MLLPFTFNSQSSNGSGVIRLYENLHSAALSNEFVGASPFSAWIACKTAFTVAQTSESETSGEKNEPFAATQRNQVSLLQSREMARQSQQDTQNPTKCRYLPSLSSKINRASDSVRWKKPLAVFASR
jgi:hypothetical protein